VTTVAKVSRSMTSSGQAKMEVLSDTPAMQSLSRAPRRPSYRTWGDLRVGHDGAALLRRHAEPVCRPLIYTQGLR